MVQVEFRDIQLYDESKPEKDTHNIEAIAIRFIGNVFAVFLDTITPYNGMNTLTGANHLIAAKCGDVGVIAGGDRMEFVTYNGLISEEEIATLSKKWWEYWKDYWRLRGTRNAYQKDWACEVTIPVNPNNP